MCTRKGLLNKKLYLAAGVAAAFEPTLKAEHIEKAVETCVKIKDLYPTHWNTLQGVACSLLFTAHSHSWKGANSTPERNIEHKLRKSDYSHVLHPRLGPLCCRSWELGRLPHTANTWTKCRRITAYVGHTHYRNRNSKHFNPIGTLISRQSLRLAWEDPSLRDLARYYIAQVLMVVEVESSVTGLVQFTKKRIVHLL